MKILILGATGMLGFEVFRTCIERGIDVHSVVRNKRRIVERLGEAWNDRIHSIDDIKEIVSVEAIISKIKPDYIINCIGIVKQSNLAEDYYESVAINAFLPHQLQKLCLRYTCRLIHVSTDCVFDGKKGLYKEADLPNAYDLYGKSKHLGEVGYGTGITIRTSIIGHEATSHTHGLVEWFLAQKGKVKGFTRAIFSGLTTRELTKVIIDVIIKQNLPSGLYQIAAQPISKYDLLKLIAEVYAKEIEIEPSEDLVIDRSLDGSYFTELTGYVAPNWFDMVKEMKMIHEPEAVDKKQIALTTNIKIQ